MLGSHTGQFFCFSLSLSLYIYLYFGFFFNESATLFGGNLKATLIKRTTLALSQTDCWCAV